MKRNLIIVASMLLLAGCSKEEQIPEKGKALTLSDTVLHFTSKASESRKITVNSASKWSVVVDVDWISTEKQADTLYINASPHRSLQNRETSIKIVDVTDPQNKMEVRIRQDHGTAKYYRMDFGGIPIERLSHNKRWAAGEWETYGIVYDLHHIADPSYLGTLYNLVSNPELIVDQVFSLRGVSDYGDPYAKGVTPDGRVTVYSSGFTELVSSVIVNGVSYPLPFPDTWRTHEDEYHGAIPDLISSDGKYILGRIIGYGDLWVACKWTLTNGSYVFSEIAPAEIVEQENWPPYIDIVRYPRAQNINGLSPDGKYSCGVIRGPAASYGQPRFNMPYIYNMETGDLVKLEDENNAISTYVTDDATLFYATPNAFPIQSDRTPYVYKNGVKQTFAEWVKSKYDIDIENKGIVKAVSNDGDVVVWIKGDNSTHFIIVTP